MEKPYSTTVSPSHVTVPIFTYNTIMGGEGVVIQFRVVYTVYKNIYIVASVLTVSP